jgi:hypothetical protein
MEIDLQLVRGQAQQRSDPGGPAITQRHSPDPSPELRNIEACQGFPFPTWRA